MTGRDLWDGFYSQVSEIFRLMLTQEKVEAVHPRLGSVAGIIDGIILRPGTENLYEIRVSASVKEADRNSVYICNPEHIRRAECGSKCRKAGDDLHHVDAMQTPHRADLDHSGLHGAGNRSGAAGVGGAGEDPRGDECGKLQGGAEAS